MSALADSPSALVLFSIFALLCVREFGNLMVKILDKGKRNGATTKAHEAIREASIVEKLTTLVAQHNAVGEQIASFVATQVQHNQRMGEVLAKISHDQAEVRATLRERTNGGG